MPETPSLYGIEHSNRNFSDPYYWGKNQFSSSFPVALACYMRDTGRTAVSITHSGGRATQTGEISFDDVFGTSLPNGRLKFSFESAYRPFEPFVEDGVDKIDVVVSEADGGRPLRPLEIKLTTLPDDRTSTLDEASYGSELVVRSPTMCYAALSMGVSCFPRREEVRAIFDDACRSVTDWGNVYEMLAFRDAIFAALECFLETFRDRQKPLLLQPVWKTKGKLPVLCDQCLDVFVWSDFALARLFLDRLGGGGASPAKKITRHQRAALRLARFLYELSKNGRVFQRPIYDGMTFATLNDKEFSVSGEKTNAYMRCGRLTAPCVSKNEIKKIVLGGGQKLLSPERRFDSILYFSKELFDE